jgi:hypothetical protein
MRGGSSRAPIVYLVTQALVIVICAEAIAIPAKRPALLCAVTGPIGMRSWVTGRRRQRRGRAALAARLAIAR